MIRSDGSVRSVNLPVWDNRCQIRDFGLYKAVIREIIYIDDEINTSTSEFGPAEVEYTVMVVGGDRDGQIFQSARLLRGLGGFSNYEEVGLNKTEGISKLDPANIFAAADPSISSVPTFNGDVVYVQFLNGELRMPMIVGLGHHQKAPVEAAKDKGQRYRRKFNGIYTEITKDGEFTWSKDNGAFVPFLTNPDDPLYPFVNQFAPLPSQSDAIKVTLDNKYNFKFEYSLLGLNVAISGLSDSFAFTTSSGASVKLSGLIDDSFEAATVLGTAIRVLGGPLDKILLEAATGTQIAIDGLLDSVSLTDVLGDQISVSALNGIQASTSTGTLLSMKNGAVALSSAGGAKLVLGIGGTIHLGNSAGDVLKDILGVLLQTLGSETASGFGAPLTSVAKYIELATKLNAFTG